MYVCHFAHGGDTFPVGTMSLLEGSSGLQEAHESLSQFGQRNYRIMLVPCHDTMPSFMIFRRVLELQELKNQVSQSFWPSHDAQMFEFHSHISCMGPRNSPKDTHVIFQTTLVHWSTCL